MTIPRLVIFLFFCSVHQLLFLLSHSHILFLHACIWCQNVRLFQKSHKVQTSKPKRISLTVHAGRVKIERETEKERGDYTSFIFFLFFFFFCGLEQQAKAKSSWSLRYLSLHNNMGKETLQLPSRLELPDQHLALKCASQSVSRV